MVVCEYSAVDSLAFSAINSSVVHIIYIVFIYLSRCHKLYLDLSPLFWSFMSENDNKVSLKPLNFLKKYMVFIGMFYDYRCEVQYLFHDTLLSCNFSGKQIVCVHARKVLHKCKTCIIYW